MRSQPPRLPLSQLVRLKKKSFPKVDFHVERVEGKQKNAHRVDLHVERVEGKRKNARREKRSCSVRGRFALHRESNLDETCFPFGGIL